jgi:hypothetical protein
VYVFIARTRTSLISLRSKKVPYVEMRETKESDFVSVRCGTQYYDILAKIMLGNT